jgi:hypothetical protein
MGWQILDGSSAFAQGYPAAKTNVLAASDAIYLRWRKLYEFGLTAVEQPLSVNEL